RAGRLDLEVPTLLRDIDALTRAVTLDQIIGRIGEYRPLIIDDGCVYHHRMLWCENQLAERLRLRIDLPGAGTPASEPASKPASKPSGTGTTASGPERSAPLTVVSPLSAGAIDRALSEVLARPAMAGGVAIRLSDEQQEAVRQAIARRFTVISGGPGTGKTAIIVTLLRVLRRIGEPLASIALAAPTGKAANRMWSSIRRGLDAVAEPEPVDRQLLADRVEPSTLHRMLGYLPGTDRFRHHENNPLDATTVIVDEASMIDLALMERLLRSLRPDTRLVLLGDADQLPSVDAGAVLRDLVAAGTDNAEASAPPFAVRLTHSYRMDPSNPAGRAILSAATAVNAGMDDDLFDPERGSPGLIAARAATGDVAYSGIELLDSGGEQGAVNGFVDSWYARRVRGQREFARLAGKTYRYIDGAWSDADHADLTRLLAIYETSRVLTVTRRQTTGSEALNRRLHRRVLADASVDRNPDFYPGEPIMMQRNDYERGLFNGDQGVVVRVAEDRGAQHFRAVFPRGDSYALFHLDALRSHIELAFAMTVHKSQGSEFDEIALILPTVEIPLLTREMLYTGLTRARRSVVLVGTEDLVRVAVSRPGQRFSGLADKLRRRPAQALGDDGAGEAR
ncbi:MAG: exodeoxyribonuclease V subunit alpha, partial [Myxococcota bacterium]